MCCVMSQWVQIQSSISFCDIYKLAHHLIEQAKKRAKGYEVYEDNQKKNIFFDE
jgi:hypothetical protein